MILICMTLFVIDLFAPITVKSRNSLQEEEANSWCSFFFVEYGRFKTIVDRDKDNFFGEGDFIEQEYEGFEDAIRKVIQLCDEMQSYLKAKCHRSFQENLTIMEKGFPAIESHITGLKLASRLVLFTVPWPCFDYDDNDDNRDADYLADFNSLGSE